jgi:hypothetical protein
MKELLKSHETEDALKLILSRTIPPEITEMYLEKISALEPKITEIEQEERLEAKMKGNHLHY